MAIKVQRQNGLYRYYDSVTHETVGVHAPVHYYEDFFGMSLLLAESGSVGLWEDVIVGSATVDVVDALDNGCLQVALDATSEAQDGVAYWGDVRSFCVDHTTQFECRLKASVLPTSGTTAVWGLAGDHNLAKDSVAEHAWFRLDGSGALDVETDDTTNDNDDKTTGVTLLATDWKVYRIDFTTISDVKFYVDGVRVASGTTFDMSNLTAAEAHMQPYFSLDKASGTSVGTLQVDYVRVWGKRT